MAEVAHTRERARRFLIRALSRIHARAYRISKGRILDRLAGMPVLLLTTTGRRSGRARTATLTYFRDGGDLLVIGSFGGSDLPPAWWLNLQRDPRASVLIGGTTSKVTARAATAGEHDRLWPLVTETYSGYARYQERTARPIPIVLLTPLNTEGLTLGSSGQAGSDHPQIVRAICSISSRVNRPVQRARRSIGRRKRVS